MPKIYIAGKVTGEPLKECKEKFLKAEFLLKRKGNSVVNPMRLCSVDSNWKAAMKICIKNLIDCDEIYMLTDWKKSKGARIEHFIAIVIGLKIFYESKGVYRHVA